MNSTKFRILFFTFFSCGFVGAAVLAGVAMWPLWLRHQAVTRLVETVQKPSKDWPSFWSRDKKWLKEFEEPLGRVKDLAGEQWAAGRLTRIVEDGDGDDRGKFVPCCRAIALLSELGPDARVAVPALERAITYQADDVRGFAAIALGNLGETARPAFPSLLSALRAEQEDDSVRRAIIESLRRIDADAAADALSFRPILQEINAAPSVLGWGDCNPAALVRVVNHLQSLGKANAIAALREYAELAYMDNSPHGGEDSKSIDSSDQQRLHLIIPLLFERADPNEKLPEYRSFGDDTVKLTADDWRRFYVTLEDDLPFHDVAVSGRTGPPYPTTNYLVAWAKDHGKLRSRPLRPPDNPLDAADGVVEKLTAREQARADQSADDRRGYIRSLRGHVRRQAVECVAHLIRGAHSKRIQYRWWDDSDEEWEKIKRRVLESGIRWDADRQEYVTLEPGGE